MVRLPCESDGFSGNRSRDARWLRRNAARSRGQPRLHSQRVLLLFADAQHRLRDQLSAWLRHRRRHVLPDSVAAGICADVNRRHVQNMFGRVLSWQCGPGHGNPRLRPNRCRRALHLSLRVQRGHLYGHLGPWLLSFQSRCPARRVATGQFGQFGQFGHPTR